MDFFGRFLLRLGRIKGSQVIWATFALEHPIWVMINNNSIGNFFFTSCISHRKTAKHNERPKAGELLDARQLEVVQVDQAESRPEESLTGFPEADNFKRVSVMVGKW